MKIISNDEYNQVIECMKNANTALIELKTENDKLKRELEVVKNNLVKATVMGELTCDNCGCLPNVIYTTSKGRFCESCKPAS